MKKTVTKKPLKKPAAKKRLIDDPRFIDSYDHAVLVADALKTLGKKVVLTLGVFDLIHEGHARYLQIAKSHGDFLMVGVDSDALTKQRKGPSRPIVPESERVEMLLHLRHVDYVVLRDAEHDINDLTRMIRPDVLITSSSTGDFPPAVVKSLQKYCGQIVTFPPQATTSTTARIRQLTIDGATSLADEIRNITEQFISKIRGA